jgi:hypothetical protein
MESGQPHNEGALETANVQVNSEVGPQSDAGASQSKTWRTSEHCATLKAGLPNQPTMEQGGLRLRASGCATAFGVRLPSVALGTWARHMERTRPRKRPCVGIINFVANFIVNFIRTVTRRQRGSTKGYDKGARQSFAASATSNECSRVHGKPPPAKRLRIEPMNRSLLKPRK